MTNEEVRALWSQGYTLAEFAREIERRTLERAAKKVQLPPRTIYPDDDPYMLGYASGRADAAIIIDELVTK